MDFLSPESFISWLISMLLNMLLNYVKRFEYPEKHYINVTNYVNLRL